ncbi:helix-turn-helix domain-containing protein (plasmid) [Pantoea dispersa]|uniref:Helix-turn-helix transcriptional regulator n=1 Tax=Pantoea dispersa TaxID=59814 RepID=A0ABY2ZU28_9GAMM|nr:helix-turn-helix domain-containing protein [Pantoea dispersa]TQC70017.1 helix-turn-helix transcriptional regulator [Pantoea dispersa]
MRKRRKIYSCGLEAALAVVGGKWKFLILWVLSNQGTKRFGEMRRAVTGISEKMLIQELKELELDGIIARKDFGEVPPRVEYSLTAQGIKLGEAIEPLCEWGTKNIRHISGQPTIVEPVMPLLHPG